MGGIAGAGEGAVVAAVHFTGPKPEIIFFDVYGTLAGFDPPREQIQQRAAAQFGMELDREGIDRGYRDADQFMSEQNSSSPVRLMSPEERDQFFARYEQLVLAGAGQEVDLETASKIWIRVRSQEYGWALFDDVIPGFEKLKQAGLRIAALSNMPYSERRCATRLGLPGTSSSRSRPATLVRKSPILAYSVLR